MKHIISIKDYKTFAGPDWPSYEDMLAGAVVDNPEINDEIEQFRQIMIDTYNQTLLHGETLAEQNQQRQNQLFFDKQYNKTVCKIPWETLGIHTNGDVFICSSPSWVPKFVGNIFENSDIFDILNSDTARSIRQEILQGRYLYCNNRICSFFANVDKNQYRYHSAEQDTPLPLTDSADLLVTEIPKNLIFDFDFTCNFQCPSCRDSLINNNKHHIIRPINDRISEYVKHRVIDQIKTQPVSIRWCGGEPFISEPYLDILSYIVKINKSNIKNIIQTNGSYLKKKQDLVTGLLPFVSEFRVSFDAASSHTYSTTRVNGNWNTLIDNVKWLREAINQSGCSTKLIADFVIQRANYREIPEFVKLCNDLGVDTIYWQKMWNWGTWPQEEFRSNNVYTSDHPEFEQVVNLLKQSNQPYSKI